MRAGVNDGRRERETSQRFATEVSGAHERNGSDSEEDGDQTVEDDVEDRIGLDLVPSDDAGNGGKAGERCADLCQKR